MPKEARPTIPIRASVHRKVKMLAVATNQKLTDVATRLLEDGLKNKKKEATK